MFIHTVKTFLKFLPLPPCVTFRQPLVLTLHINRPLPLHMAAAVSDSRSDPQQGSLLLGTQHQTHHGDRPRVATCGADPQGHDGSCDGWLRDGTRHLTWRVPCSWLVTLMRKTQPTSPLEESYPTADSTFSCFQPVILRLWIYGVFVRWSVNENQGKRACWELASSP